MFEKTRRNEQASVLRIGYKVYGDKGRRVASGFVDGGEIEVPRGTYQVHTDTAAAVVIKDVRIGKLTHTSIRLRRTDEGLRFELEGPSE